MELGRVVGTVVSSMKVEGLIGEKLLMVQGLNLTTMEPEGAVTVAVDTVGAGESETILLVKGSSARLTVSTDKKPVDAAIIGIVDSLELGGVQIYTKYTAAAH